MHFLSLHRWLLPLLALPLLGAARAEAPAAYHQPSAAVRELLDAPALPRQLISPERQTLATLEMRRHASIEELARPQLRLAGLRFDPACACRTTSTPLQRLRLRPLLNPDAPERVVDLAGNAGRGAQFHSFSWAPDGRHFILERRSERANELWVGEAGTGRIRAIAGVKLNDILANGEPVWLSARELLVPTVPARRGAAPQAARAPQGPSVLENHGRPTPERAHADLLRTRHDEALLEYHARATLTVVDIASGATRELAGGPALYSSIASVGGSPNAQYLLTERLQRPFSHNVPAGDFPRSVELRQRDGKLLRELARIPLRTGATAEGITAAPRAFQASPFADASIYWVEALDGGNPAARVNARDRLMRLAPPYLAEPQEVLRLPQRFAQLLFLEDGQHALLSENDRGRAWTRTLLMPLAGGPLKALWDHSVRERYRHPGTPMMRMLPGNGRSVAMVSNGDLLLTGPGASPRGERPFLDRFSLDEPPASATTRVFHSSEQQYEFPVAMLDGGRMVTQRESAVEPPNLVLRDGTGSSALTRVKDPTPQLRKVRRELVSFKRPDGVELSFWLYLPPDYKEGEKRPALVWAYPMEFADNDTAGQLKGSGNRFTSITPLSPLHLLMDGFVVLFDATMPIVGDPRTVNDSFIEQITMNARAIVDKAEDLGSVDVKRLAVGGHSYGAFMAVNLLAHTDLFKAGIARSGAYNRTLTPFGFQAERRTLWDARELYLKLSPLLYANQIREPLLLTHGELDVNPGTPPLQSERLYQALAGTGDATRYVALPFEGHNYTARESVGHVQWEMSQWLRTYLGDPRAGVRD